MAVFKYGKNPKRTDRRTLALARFVTPQASPPAAANWGTAMQGQWGMLGNDTVGDCAWAGQAHADMLWAANGEHATLSMSTADVLAAYSACTGYNPDAAPDANGHNPTDRGTDLLTALKYWRSTGIDSQKIEVFTEIDPQNIDHVKLAIALTGCVYVGVQLPESVEPRSETDVPDWMVTPDGTPQNQSNPNAGHCIIYTGYDANTIDVITWGRQIKATWGFHQAYCDEIYSMISPDWFDQTGTSPTGLNLTALMEAVANLGAAPATTT
jgi:hypothetical protein